MKLKYTNKGNYQITLSPDEADHLEQLLAREVWPDYPPAQDALNKLAHLLLDNTGDLQRGEEVDA